MADTVKSTEYVVLVGEFRDGDDRSINIDNPGVNVNDATNMAAYAASINAVGAYAKQKNILIGDKAGADFIRFKSAKHVNRTAIDFEIS